MQNSSVVGCRLQVAGQGEGEHAGTRHTPGQISSAYPFNNACIRNLHQSTAAVLKYRGKKKKPGAGVSITELTALRGMSSSMTFKWMPLTLKLFFISAEYEMIMECAVAHSVEVKLQQRVFFFFKCLYKCQTPPEGHTPSHGHTDPCGQM